MTPECKRVKVMSLVSLAVGLAEIVAGFVMPTPFGVSIFAMFVPMMSGVLALIMGVHGARAANVPAKAAALVPFACVMCALACACVGVAAYLSHGLSPIAGVTAAPAVIDALIALFARQVKKALDRA